MNKFILKYKTPSLIAFVLLGMSSCLKDKGYENGTYGMGAITGGQFVGIPAAGSSPFSIALESKAGNQALSLFFGELRKCRQST